MSGKDKGKEGYLAPKDKILLRLNSISLTQFRNYTQASFQFKPRIVGISGANGVGKTNLLDAIYYLCFTKSYFARSDVQNSKTGMEGFRLEGTFELDGRPLKAVCIFRSKGRKEFLINDNSYDRFADHIGRFPCVIIAPDDVRIITDGSEERRRFIDALLSQIDSEYLQRLMNYNRILFQRNSCLKSIAENRISDFDLLDVYDKQLVTDGEFIFKRRSSLLEEGVGIIKDFYKKIASSEECLELRYESQLSKTSFPVLLEEFRRKDIQLQRSNAGIHKDDLIMSLQDQPFKNIASQGQRKSLLFAMKLAEFELLKKHKGFPPLLLLDDVFEKLDQTRMHNLLDWVCMQNDGQVFITDTHQTRIVQHLDKLRAEYQLLDL